MRFLTGDRHQGRPALRDVRADPDIDDLLPVPGEAHPYHRRHAGEGGVVALLPGEGGPLSGWLSRACLGKSSLFSPSSQIAAWNENSKPKVHHMILFWTLYVYV